MSSYHKNKILPSYFSSLWKSIQGNDSSCGMTTAFNMSSSITSISLAKKQKNYTFHYVIFRKHTPKTKKLHDSFCHLIANTRQKPKNYTIHYVILSQTHTCKNIISSYSRNSSCRAHNKLIWNPRKKPRGCRPVKWNKRKK